MSLPSLAHLSSAPAATLRAFGRKLASIGVSLDAAAPIVSAAQAVAPGIRQPIRAFHLRRLDTPVGWAMRMFLFADPVTIAEARVALGDLTDELLDLGRRSLRAGRRRDVRPHRLAAAVRAEARRGERGGVPLRRRDVRELSLRLLAHVAPHLAPKGRALLLAEWPDHGTDALDLRLRKAMDTGDVSLLLLRMPHTELDGHAVSYAAGLHPGLGRPFEREALLRREHLEKMGIRALLPTLVVVARADPTPGWTTTVSIEPLSKVSFTSERIDRLLAAQIVGDVPERLLAARVRVPEGAVLSQEQIGPGAAAPSTLHVRFPPAALIPPIQLTIELLALFTFLHEAPTVRAGLQRFADEMELPLDEVKPRSIEAIARALREGVLELA